MTDNVDDVLWCKDCLLKHASDLLHHAKSNKNPRLKRLAGEAFDIASKMADVRDSKSYRKIRDLEHRAEDLMAGLRQERKKLQEECPNCRNPDDLNPKHLNRGSPQELSNGGNMARRKELSYIRDPLVGNVVGKGISVVTPMVITGSSFGVANKTLANLGIGAVLTGLALYGRLKKANMIGAIAGTNLIANEVVDLVMGYIPTPVPPAAVRAPVAAPAAPVAVAAKGGAPASLYQTTAFGAPGASQQYSDGSLIFVD